MSAITLRVNGGAHTIDVDPSTPLLYVLRNDLGLRGPRFGCGLGQCGACMVLRNGKRAFSCQVSVEQAAGQRITTVEGLDGSRLGRTVKRAWLEEAVPQCGYCQSGQIVSAVDLLSTVKNPTREQIKGHMASNLCRCGTYERIVRAVARASKTA
jgi:isoquinoline 1-oxidoreductase subunit alpha